MAEINGMFIVHTLMALVFLISGLVINAIQGLVYLLFYHVNKNLYRKINYYLIYTSWSQIVAMAEWWSGSSCNIYGDEEALNMFGREHSIVVMNHKYDVDWLMCWFVCDKLGMLGNAKTCAKKSLKHIPVIGWGWVFAEMIFLERSWEKDKQTLGAKLDNLVDYKDPIMLLMFCEGTRFTPEKHEASMEFAKANNLPQLKHHLLPRTKGFNFSVAHLKSKTDAIFDVQLAFPKDTIKPTFSNMLHGHKLVGDMYIRRFPIQEIPTGSEEETSAWLYNLYQEKDKIMDDYMKTNRFPGKCNKLKRTPCSLINGVFWAVSVGFPFLYFIFMMLTTGIPWVTACTVTVIILLLSAVYMMIGVTMADKGSSYGKVTTPTTRNGVIEMQVVNGNFDESDKIFGSGDNKSLKNSAKENSERKQDEKEENVKKDDAS